MSTALQYKTKLEKKIENTPTYIITDEDRAAKDYFKNRLEELKLHRQSKGIEDIWKAADIAYVPHNLKKAKGKTVLASNDETGWRSSQVILGKDNDWQEDSVAPNPYIKIQIALGIIVDRNPEGVFNPGAKKYEANTRLMENLYQRTWDIAKSKSVLLKPLVLNMAKYGMGVGRTFPLKIERTLRNGDKHVYYDDVFRENLSPWNVWFDDAAIVGNVFSINDAVYYKDYAWDKFEEQFGHLDNFQYVKPTQRTLDSESSKLVNKKEGMVSKITERVWFYENLSRDSFYVQTDNGVVLVNDEIPKSAKNKKLSIWPAHWTLRNDKDIEGIGLYEAMRNDHKLHTKIRAMTMDQLVLSIYKEFFYSGTDKMEGDGQMKTAPGKGRQVVEPQNIRWNEIPGPGSEAWEALRYQEEKMEDSTGVTKTLQGQIVGKTAFESSQAAEAALKRLKTPLENITDGLELDAYITVGIIEDLYGVPKVKLVAEDRYIKAVELQKLEEEALDNGTEMPETKQIFREVPLNVERDDSGKITKSKENKFFDLKDEDFPWEGIIVIKAQSIVAGSELLDRVSTIEMANLLVPIFQMPPEIGKKVATEIIKKYDKDPEDWLPDAWLQQEGQANPLFMQQGQQPGAGNAQTVIPQSQIGGPSADIKKITQSPQQIR